MNLLGRVDGDVARSRNHHAHAVERAARGGEHLLDEVHEPVAGSLGPHLGPSPGEALAGENAGFIAVRDALVLPEQVADLPFAHAGVAGGDIGVLADVAVKLGHERLAEPHYLTVGATLGIEVAASLAPTDGQ